MNTSPTAASASSRTERAHSRDDADDLDARILDAERAVIERDQRVQRRTQALVDRGQRLVERVHDNFGRVLGVGVAVGTGAIVAARVLPHVNGGHPHRRRAPRAASALRLDGQEHAAAQDGRREMPWASVLALAWPLMPRALRSRISPRMAAFLISLGLPLLVGHRHAASATRVRSAPHVDLQRYAGRWYEIARLPLGPEDRRCGGGNVSALYRLLPDGGIAIANRCRSRRGGFTLAEGRARVVPRSNGSQLEVTFAPRWLRALPWVWSDYWVLRVDDDYRSALVGTPDHKHLWLLSRTPRLAGSDYQRLVEHAEAEGYDTSRLELTPQSRR
jgi:lipocalin